MLLKCRGVVYVLVGEDVTLFVCLVVVMCWWELMPRQKAVGLQDGGIALYKTSNAKGKE